MVRALASIGGDVQLLFFAIPKHSGTLSTTGAFYPVVGRIEDDIDSGTEGLWLARMPIAGTVKSMRVEKLSPGNMGAGVTMVLRHNEADSALTAAFAFDDPAGTVVSDTDDVVLAAGDSIDLNLRADSAATVNATFGVTLLLEVAAA